MGQSGFRHSSYGLGEHKHKIQVTLRTTQWSQSLPLHKHLCFILNIKCMSQTSQAACNFLPSTKGFSASSDQQRILFLEEVLCFWKATSLLEHKVVRKLGSHRIFSSLRFYFSVITLILHVWGQVTWAKYLHMSFIDKVQTMTLLWVTKCPQQNQKIELSKTEVSIHFTSLEMLH